MKKKLLLISFSIAFYAQVVAQWATQISNSGAELRGIYFTSSTHGYAVGSGGEMVETNDAGQNWLPIYSSTADTLRTVFFTTDSIGFVGGANGTIMRTTDAGFIWTSVGGVTTNLIRSIHFPTADTGYACGGGGIIIKTTDAGLTWTALSSGITQDLINIRFANSSVGYAVSSLSTFTNGLVLRTVDGGVTWTTVFSDSRGILALCVPSPDVIFCGGNGEAIFRSTDGGTTWDTVSQVVGSANNLRNGWFVNDLRGYIGGDLGSVYSTSDGGNTWLLENPTTNGVLGMHYYNSDTLYVCGNLGTILRYTTPCSPATPGVISGPDSICSNQSVTYTINSVANATSYNWIFPIGTTIVSGQGDTSITVLLGPNSGLINVSAVNGCGPSLPSTLNVLIGVTPSTPGIIQTGQSLTSTVSGVLQWFLNGTLITGATSQVYTPQQSGNYSVMITGASGCTAISGTFYFSMAGINVNEVFASVHIIPNPSSDITTLNFELLKNAQVNVKAFDISGKEIFMKSLFCNSGSMHSIPFVTKTWDSGIYFIQIETGDALQWMKFVKE